MTQNPFETPHAADPQYQGAGGGGGGSGRIDIGAALSEGWRSTWSNFPLWLGAMFVAWIINFIAGLTFIGYFVVTPVIMYGMIKLMLNMLEDKAEFGDLFVGFSNFGAALLPMLAFGFVVIGIPYIPLIIGVATESQTMISISGLIFLVWFFAVMTRLGFAGFYIVDRGMGAGDALRASWEATSGQVFVVIGLMLLSSLIVVVGVFALFIGVIPAVMVVYQTYAAAYRQMAGK